jgi:hypothetical protein
MNGEQISRYAAGNSGGGENAGSGGRTASAHVSRLPSIEVLKKGKELFAIIDLL